MVAVIDIPSWQCVPRLAYRGSMFSSYLSFPMFYVAFSLVFLSGLHRVEAIVSVEIHCIFDGVWDRQSVSTSLRMRGFMGRKGMWSFVLHSHFLTGWILFLLYPLISYAAFRFFLYHLADFSFRVDSWLLPFQYFSLFFTLFLLSFFPPVTSLVGLADGFLCDKLRNWKWPVFIGVWYILRGIQ